MTLKFDVKMFDSVPGYIGCPMMIHFTTPEGEDCATNPFVFENMPRDTYEWLKMLDNCIVTLIERWRLNYPVEQEELIQHVGYDEEQCGREK